jgi:hypothetical protein
MACKRDFYHASLTFRKLLVVKKTLCTKLFLTQRRKEHFGNAAALCAFAREIFFLKTKPGQT